AALDAAGVGLAICSNKPQFLCEKILGDLALARHFRAIIGSALDRARKPAPDCAVLALAALGGSSADTLYCGDSAIDVATARAVGLPIALVAWGYGTAEALAEEPDTPVFASISAIREAAEQHDLSAFWHG
ncbi:MAG TPA: HAD family hydrolase, partial [Erythrobacter sp.]|nr:HAD family hydrolase [Erythrobacter sp.]